MDQVHVNVTSDIQVSLNENTMILKYRFHLQLTYIKQLLDHIKIILKGCSI